MIGIPLGLVYTNAAEWFLHKHLLHRRGKRRGSWWSFHFHEHHRASRLHDMVDPDYRQSVWGKHAQGKEALALFGAGLLHLPLLPVAPFFTATVWYATVHYWRVHRKAHLDRDWAREHLPWHYDHHMAPNQDANWCVTRPWFDHLMGTRVPYVGTAREARDRLRRMQKRERRAA